ncbi:MAG: MarR family transcriptional regulator [Bacteroidia bacterium]|nr:MarR family transcriptional regulator [Bacteroidia bacterium]
MSETNIDKVAENLMAILPLLHKNLIKRVKSKTNIPVGSLFVMSVLKSHGILSMSEIGHKLAMPNPHITGLVDRLIAEGLAERINEPHDRRIVNIKITEKGIESFIAIKKDISEDLRKKLSELDENKLKVLSGASRQVKEILITIFNEEDHGHCKSLSVK